MQRAGGVHEVGGVQDVAALARFELFYVTAVATVIIVRTFLAATGYPKVGSSGPNGLHIAHVLWGGLLMGVAIVILCITPGTRAHRRAALFGGIGFGLFIDEIGKFLTTSVNYFFQPAIALIYAVFVIMFLLVREVVLRRSMTPARRLAVASSALSDLALGQLHDDARRRALAQLDLLEGDQHASLVAAVREGLAAEPPCHDGHFELRLTRTRNRMSHWIRRQIDVHSFDKLLFTLLFIGVAGTAAELGLMIFGPNSGARDLTIAACVSTGLSAVYSAFGLFRLARGNRAGALRVMFRATLVTVLFTQIAVFFQYQLTGVLGLFFGLAVLALLRLLVESGVAPARSPAPGAGSVAAAA